LSYKNLKLKLKVFLTGCIVAMVTCYIKGLTTTCLLGHLCDTIELETIVSHLKPYFNRRLIFSLLLLK